VKFQDRRRSDNDRRPSNATGVEKECPEAEQHSVGRSHLPRTIRLGLRPAMADSVRRLSATIARPPPVPSTSASVVKRWASNTSRSFMAEKGREGYLQVQDCPSCRFQVIITNSPPSASLRNTLREHLVHYNGESNHQGKGNILLFPSATTRVNPGDSLVRCRKLLGGLLRYYHQEAA